MAVYVDDMHRYKVGRYGRLKMSHMIADTPEELIDMVKKIGVDPKWIQNKGTPYEHFDIAKSKRALAIVHGAQQLTMRQLTEKIHSRAKAKGATHG